MRKRAIDRFTDEMRLLTTPGESWLVCAHRRNPVGFLTEGATACVARPAVEGETATPAAADKLDAMRETLFGRALDSKRIRLSTLKGAVGRADWRDEWMPRSRSVFGHAAFDMVLAARALACLSGDPMVTLEVGHYAKYACGILRVIAPSGWRACVAARRDEGVPALRLTRRPVRHAA